MPGAVSFSALRGAELIVRDTSRPDGRDGVVVHAAGPYIRYRERRAGRLTRRERRVSGVGAALRSRRKRAVRG